MDERTILWILGAVITLFTAAIVYVLKELADSRKRIHAKNNDISKLIVEIQLNAKGVSGMVTANEKSLSETKSIVEQLMTLLNSLSNELSRLSGQLDKR